MTLIFVVCLLYDSPLYFRWSNRPLALPWAYGSQILNREKNLNKTQMTEISLNRLNCEKNAVNGLNIGSWANRRADHSHLNGYCNVGTESKFNMDQHGNYKIVRHKSCLHATTEDERDSGLLGPIFVCIIKTRSQPVKNVSYLFAFGNLVYIKC